MQPDDYAPFPEADLLSIAQRYDEADFPAEAALLRNAVKCYEALRERCLLAEQRAYAPADVEAMTRCLDADVWITVMQYEDAKPLEALRDRVAAWIHAT